MIRLACIYCDREDQDGVESVEVAKAAGWVGVFTDHDDSRCESSAFHWWDHLGTCPDCHVGEDDCDGE